MLAAPRPLAPPVLAFVLLALAGRSVAQTPPPIAWERTYGGPDLDEFVAGLATPGGGYVLCGATYSFGSGRDDVYLVKTDARGDELWSRTFGGGSSDRASSVAHAKDGGFALAGSTQPLDARGEDIYLLRTDADGNLLWSRTFGGESHDFGYAVVATEDGEFLVAGITGDYYAFEQRAYLIKTDGEGNELWSRSYGEEDTNYAALDVHPTADGAYAVCGRVDTCAGSGECDRSFLMKVGADGDEVWRRELLQGEWSHAFDVAETDDGGFIVAGSVFTSSERGVDVLLVRTDARGEVLWSEVYGETTEYGRAVALAEDGGFAVCGYTLRQDPERWQGLVFEVDAAGALRWSLDLEGEGSTSVFDLQRTDDGGFAVFGGTRFLDDSDYDAYLVKLSPEDNAFGFLRSDCNGDGVPADISDAVYLLQYNFQGGEPPPCCAACDANADGDLDGVTDAVYALSYAFSGGAPPPEPFPRCGPGSRETDAVLGCETPPECVEAR